MKKKLIFVIPFLVGGGAERVTAVLASEISRMEDYEVHIMTYAYNPERDYPIAEGVSVHSLGQEASGIFTFLKKLSFFRNTIQNIAPYCVISLGGSGVIALLTVAMVGLKVPLILSERNDPRKNPKKWYLRMLRQWAYSQCDGIVFQTHEAMEYFSASIQRKGCVICNPLTGELPARFTGERDKRIVTSCRLNAQKNLDLLIDAFSDIAQQFEDYSLHIYGEGEERPHLEEKIRSAGLDKRIILEGYSSRIYDDIRKAAMFVLSSDYEGISNSMLEAIALGIPTVATDCPVGGARETITHALNGLLVPVRDREKLSCAMAMILKDKVFAESISVEGEKLRNTISKNAIARRWIALVERVEKNYVR